LRCGGDDKIGAVVEVRRVEIRTNDDLTAQVLIGDVDISNFVTSLRLDMEARSTPVLSLELIPDELLVDLDESLLDVLRSCDDG
jgi:excinuclease UvrABC helicase subunit UvrB